MAKPQRTTAPAFQFYPKDFLSSTKVQRMSLTEVGAYTVLLSHCWLSQGLPTDINQLARIVKVPDKQFARMWKGPLSECFYERGGQIQNERLDVERKKQTEYRRRQSDNAASGWHRKRQRRGNAVASPDAMPPPMPKNGLRSPISDLQSPSTSANADVPERADVLFAQFRNAYPENRRKGGPLVEQMFLGALGVAGFPALMAALDNHRASEQWRTARLIPGMDTWFAEERWRQRLDPPNTNGSGRTGAPPKGKYDGIELRDE